MLDFLLNVYVPNHPTLKAGTVYLYTRAVLSLEQYHGRRIAVGELSKELLLPWIASRVRKVSAKTAHRELKDVLTLWRFAFVEQSHGLNPDTLRIPRLSLPRAMPVAWTIADISKLLAACHNLKGFIRGTTIPRSVWRSAYLLFLYDTGCRPTAALRVRTADVNLQHQYVLLRYQDSKTSMEQVCNLSDQAVAAIAGLYEPPREFLFPYPYSRDHLWRVHKKLCKAAGLPSDRYHSLGCIRRTTASYAAANGGTELAQRALGHTTPNTTVKHYIDPRIARPQSAVDVLPRPKL